MFASVTSVALDGVDPIPVRVEAHVSGSKPAFHLVGIPDTAVREAKERVRAAVESSGWRFPSRRVTVNLAPAEIPKSGSAYDLPIALAVLLACGEPPGETDAVALGELALDGAVRPARGALGASLVGRERDAPVLLPSECVDEASIVADARVGAVRSLAEAMAVMAGSVTPLELVRAGGARPAVTNDVDLGVVRGQLLARRALEVAAAGGHHLLMVGPPGSGKSLLASCLPSILPPLDEEQMLEVAQAWAAAGLPRRRGERPPFRSPHHTATVAAIVGGGSGVPTPGELTLAHRGVLFLDELGEFPPRLLDALRQPLEDGRVTVARQGRSVTFPCVTQIVAATNPCPCGFRGDRLVACRCTPRGLDRYRARLSGPLLDRFDARVTVERLDVGSLNGPRGESSESVRTRVVAARQVQAARGRLNAELRRDDLDEMSYSSGATSALETYGASRATTARGWDRVRRVARTIADLAGSDVIGADHIREAVELRGDWS